MTNASLKHASHKTQWLHGYQMSVVDPEWYPVSSCRVEITVSYIDMADCGHWLDLVDSKTASDLLDTLPSYSVIEHAGSLSRLCADLFDVDKYAYNCMLHIVGSTTTHQTLSDASHQRHGPRLSRMVELNIILRLMMCVDLIFVYCVMLTVR